jgi:hypothetical protein
MRVSYGPPGHKGVSQLMAVGDDEYATPTESAVKTGQVLAGAVWLVGLIGGSRTLRGWGFGATMALLGVRAAAKRRAPRPAPVVIPAGHY